MSRRFLHGALVYVLGLLFASACTWVGPLRPGPVALTAPQVPVQAAAVARSNQDVALTTPMPQAPPITDVFMHVPAQRDPSVPLPVLLVLHGMGGNGPDMARELLPEAERQGWLVVTPTLSYRDWRDPEQIRRDGSELLPALKALIDELPARTGLPLEDRLLVYGFSRGGQTAHRFALFYSESVLRVASFSCGTYTLPTERIQVDTEDRPLKFPYGVSDLVQYQGQPFDLAEVQSVDFWIGVGGRDNQAGELPRQWDPYLGTTRVERARAFARVLDQLGIEASLNVFPSAEHEITTEMQSQALAFLAAPDS